MASNPSRRRKVREWPWTCGNPKWKDRSSYDYLSNLGLSQWAWEFLRRTKKYREDVDSGHSAAAAEWGLSALLPYSQAQGPSSSIVDPEATRWLSLQAFTVAQPSSGADVIQAGTTQVAVFFNLYRGMRRDILVRQLARLAGILERAASDNGNPMEHEPSRGGQDLAADTLHLCLRYADAIASNPDAFDKHVAKEIGCTPRRLSDIKEIATKLMGDSRGYLKLVERDLPPLRHSETDTRARWRTDPINADWGPMPTVDWDNLPKTRARQRRAAKKEDAKW